MTDLTFAIEHHEGGDPVACYGCGTEGVPVYNFGTLGYGEKPNDERILCVFCAHSTAWEHVNGAVAASAIHVNRVANELFAMIHREISDAP